jgi:hypothetical protein
MLIVKTQISKDIDFCEISGSHGDEDVDVGLMGCNAL